MTVRLEVTMDTGYVDTTGAQHLTYPVVSTLVTATSKSMLRTLGRKLQVCACARVHAGR